MPVTLVRSFQIVALCAMAVLTAGCVKAKQVMTVNPDGSGKMQFTFALSEETAGQMGEMPFTNLSQEDAKRMEDNGWIAFSKPVEKTENGYKSVTITGYYEDINAVKLDMGEGDPDQKMVTYHMAEGKLTVSNPMLMQMASQASAEPIPDEQKPMMQEMMKGMEISEMYDVPGELESAGAYMLKDGMAAATITAEDLLAAESPVMNKLAQGETLVITYTPKDWADGDKAAWQEELARAKTEWATMKAEATSDGGGMQEGMEVEVEEVEMAE